MKKNITRKQQVRKLTKSTNKQLHKRAAEGRLTVGLDLGDRTSHYCILDAEGTVLIRETLPTTKGGVDRVFAKLPASRVALEVGGQSPWLSRRLAALGHEVIVANPRNLAWITKSQRKNDPLDAEKLARLARVDPQMLAPIRHRGEQAQKDLALIRARAALVEARTKVINTARGLVKSLGERLDSCPSEKLDRTKAQKLDSTIRTIVDPLLRSVEQLNEQIEVYDAEIAALAQRYKESALLTEVYGVGELTAVTFLLTLEDPARFSKSRDVGAYLGFQPRQKQSGSRNPELSISKQGDRHLRWMLVQCAHCILRRGAPDSDLRRWGLQKIEEGKKQQAEKGKRKNIKKKMVVAVARKLAVLLHHLWVNGEVYDPLWEAHAAEAKTRAAA